MTDAGRPGDLRCRPAAPDDLDKAARVWWLSAKSMDGAAQEVPSLQQLRTRIDAELASGWRLTLAMRDGAIIGLLALKPAEAVLDQVFIAPDAQDTGVGSVLLAEAQRQLPGGFTLWTASVNARARRFYERKGLVDDGEDVHPRLGYPIRRYAWRPQTR